jgi:hypothetical protein
MPEMEIEEHLRKHDGVLQAKALEIARGADRPDLIEECYNAGQRALCDVHAEPGYKHEKAALLTYAWRRVLSAMRRVIAENWEPEIVPYQPMMPESDQDEDGEPIYDRIGIEHFLPACDLHGNPIPTRPAPCLARSDDYGGEREYEATGRYPWEPEREPTVDCEVCGKETPIGKRGQHKQYCSKACQRRASRKRTEGQTNPS